MPISQIRDYGQPYLEGEKTAKKLSGLLEAHRENILEEIQNADIHHAGPVAGDSGDRDTQFAHAVYVKAFPRKVLSVWVAVACLSKKRG